MNLIHSSNRIYLGFILIILIAYYINSTFKSNLTFSQVSGPIELSEDKRVAEHVGSDFVPGSFRINEIYTKGVHHVRLSFEQFSSSNTFIGIIQSTSKQSISSSHGWFIDNKQGEYQIFQILRKIWSFFISNNPRHYFRCDIKQGDIIEIKIDCINSKIILKNKQTNRKYELNIDLEQSPLPWQIIINLDRYGDRVRLQ